MPDDEQLKYEGRLFDSEFSEWNGMLSISGLIVATAAITASKPEIAWMAPFIVVACSVTTAAMCLMNFRWRKQTYLEIVNCEGKPVDDEYRKRCEIKYIDGTYHRLRNRAEKRTKWGRWLLFVAGLLTLSCFLPKDIYLYHPLQSLIFK